MRVEQAARMDQGEIWDKSIANVAVTTGLLGGVAVSMFSKTLAMLFGLLVSGVQVCGSAHQQKKAMNAHVRTVYGFAWIQFLTDNQNTAIRQGNRFAFGDRR